MLAIEGLVDGIEGLAVQVKHFLLVLLEGSHASQNRFDAADEDVHREGLGLIVVAAQLKRPHLIFAFAARGEDDQRNLRQTMPDILEQFIAVHPQALQLHQDEVPRILRQTLQACAPGMHHVRFVPATNQIVAQHGR